MSNHVGVALLVATACVASVATASADPVEPGQQGQQTQSPKPKHKAKEKEKEEEKQKQSQTAKPPKGATKAQSAEPPVVDKAKGAVEDVNKKADEDANQANRDVVGPKQQNENEQKAEDPRLRKKDNRESRETAEKVGKTTTTAAEAVGNVVQDTTRATDQPGPYKPFSIELNPLGLIIGGRVSIQGIWVPVTHHAIVVNPHFVHTSADVAITPDTKESQTFTGFGGELGYRYYTGHRGMNGVFIGPSLIGGVYNASLLGADQVFTDFGIAADVGLQTIIADHLTIGGGVGIEYLHVSHDFGDLPSGPSTIASSSVKPRLLFSGGYAF